MTVHIPQGREIDRLSNIILSLQTNHASLVEGLQRDIANAHKLIAELNIENEELVRDVICLSHENADLMACLETETSKNDTLLLQIKCLLDERYKFGLQEVATNEIKDLEPSSPLRQEQTSTATEKLCTTIGIVKSSTKDFNFTANTATFNLRLNQGGDGGGRVSGHNIIRVLNEPIQRRISLPLPNSKRTLEGRPGKDFFDECIMSRNDFTKCCSSSGCSQFPRSSLTTHLSKRQRSFSSNILSRTHSKKSRSFSDNNLNYVVTRNHSFCNTSTHSSTIPFVKSGRNVNFNFDHQYWSYWTWPGLPTHNSTREPLTSVNTSARYKVAVRGPSYQCATSNGSSLCATIDDPHLDCLQSSQSTKETWTASSSNSTLHQEARRTSSFSSALSNDINRTETVDDFHLDFAGGDTCRGLKNIVAPPLSHSILPTSWQSSLSSLTNQSGGYAAFGTRAVDYSDEHLDFGTDDTSSAVTSTTINANDNKDKTGYGTDCGGSIGGKLKGIFGRSTQARRTSGAELLVGFGARRHSCGRRKSFTHHLPIL
jgi:hypothetical protein